MRQVCLPSATIFVLNGCLTKQKMSDFNSPGKLWKINQLANKPFLVQRINILKYFCLVDFNQVVWFSGIVQAV